jgi:hypothetical protein
MQAENLETDTAIGGAVFEPEAVVNMRSGLDRAWSSLPTERRTFEIMDAMAAAIVRLAVHGERDPVQLSAYALEAVITQAPNGTL